MTTNLIEPGRTIAEVERDLIEITVGRIGKNKPAMAKMLGISLKTLYRKLNLYAANPRKAAP